MGEGSSVPNASVQVTGRDCPFRWQLLALGVLEWGEEFGAEWWFTRAITFRRS